MHNGSHEDHGGGVGVLTPDIAQTLATPEYRLEGPLKVSGRARYTGDVQLPGMLWAKFLLSPFPHARIVSIDTSAAKKVPGVHAVITAQDIGLKLMGRWIYDWPVLAYERVRYVGERVAGVAAETPEAAEEAVNLIDVEWEELPAVFDSEDALRADAPILHPDPGQYWTAGKRAEAPHLNLQGYAKARKGDADINKVFAEAHLVVEDVYEGARQHQGYIEPRGCVVWIDENEKVRVFTTCKAPFGLRGQMARTLGLPADQIVIDAHFIGGDFGGKGTAIDEFACYYLAKATGRPIRAIMTYAEELSAGAPQHYAKYYLKTAVDRDGKMLAHECRAYLNDGAYGGGRPSVDTTAGGGMECLDGYYVPNTRMEAFLVYTNLTPGGNMRAPGATHRGLAGEGHVDHIARQLGMDPLEFRIRNAMRPGQQNLTGGLIHNPRAVQVLERLKQETQWGQKPLPPNRGRGLALRNRHVGQGKAELLVRLMADASIEVLTGAPDQGGGALNVAKRVTATTLSVELDRVSVRYGTTEEAPLDGGVGGSRATHVVGQAARYGSIALKKELEELAAEVMGWPAGQVSIERDRFVVHGGESAPFEEVAKRIVRSGKPIEAVGAYDAAEHHHEDGHDYNFYVYMMEVDVDPNTGRVTPTDVLVVADIGTVINPVAHQGQLDGGFIFGYGNAAMEELVLEEGRVTNLSLGEYKLPTQMDVPPLRTIMLEPDDGPGPYGAKAAGELTNTAVPGALANAITDAVGVRIMTMPITAERVYEALQARAGH